MAKRIFVSETINKVGETVKVAGWVHARRDHGKIIFIDLRDRSGLLQVVFVPTSETYENGQTLRSEWVVELEGVIKARPEKMINPNVVTGTVELETKKIKILNESETPPFEISQAKEGVHEDIRMKYRYVDLRRERMKDNLVLRHNFIHEIRNYFNGQGFIEVETPILTKSTPEGARDFLVPSRLHAGKFYAMPQSPQQYKQLLMVAGLERYFQIARCFRDEDTRGDRQAEFTQLDAEMSFIEREDMMKLIEQFIIETVRKVTPYKHIQEMPFPRMSYHDAMKTYGTDRPDVRNDKNDPNLLAFCWVIDFPFFEKTDEGKWTFTHNPFSAPKEEWREALKKKEKIGEIITSQYDVVLNGYEIGGGSIRNHKSEDLHAVFEIMGYSAEDMQEKFGHMLQALSFGAPPHGGIAFGLDRFIMLLADEPNIREVIAFPKTGDGRDLMMNAPSDVTSRQLRELHINVDQKEQ